MGREITRDCKNQSYFERIMTNFVAGSVMSADPAISWSNAGLLSIGPSWTNFGEILIKIFIHENESEDIVREMAAGQGQMNWPCVGPVNFRHRYLCVIDGT